MIFNKSKEAHTNSLAAYMPDGQMFAAKSIHSSNFRALLRGFAGELFTAQGYLVSLDQELIPDNTVLFLSEWEKALGIPDDCFKGTGDNNERRRDILVKLASLGVQTNEDFVQLAAVFGVDVTISPLSEEILPPYDVPFNPSALPDARFILVVEGDNLVTGFPPYNVPFNLESGESILECLFKKLDPANCRVIFRNN